MKLLSYISVQDGLKGLANYAIRVRLDSLISHTEVMFEPGDMVDKLMPDGTCQPDDHGYYWCASSVAAEKLPEWSKIRAGESGGVRFKRINPNNGKWLQVDSYKDPIFAARKFKELEGIRYDWMLISKYMFWPISNKLDRRVCSEISAESLGYEEPWRFDPASLHQAELSFYNSLKSK